MYRAPTRANSKSGRDPDRGGAKPTRAEKTGLKTRHYKRPKEERWRPKGTPLRKPHLCGAEGEEVVGAFDGILEAAEELLEVFAALDEIDVGGVDDQEVGGGVAEEELFVSAGDFLDVFGGEGFAEALLALQEEVHLGAEGGAGLGVVEIGEERIVLAIVDAAGVEAFGEDLGEGGFADAQRAFDDDEVGRLRTSLRSASALGCGRVVGRHRGRGTPTGPGRQCWGL